MNDAPNERRNLAREARKIRQALDELAALALPAAKRRRPIGREAIPTLTPTDSLAELSFEEFLDPAEAVPTAPKPANDSAESFRPSSLANLDDFFNDQDVDESLGEDSDIVEPAAGAFSPGTTDDLFEGFESESDISAKVEQETLSFATRASSNDTPPNGYAPLPQSEPDATAESINDVLDGFEW